MDNTNRVTLLSTYNHHVSLNNQISAFTPKTSTNIGNNLFRHYKTYLQYISFGPLHFPGGKQDLRYVHTPYIHIAFEGSLAAHLVQLAS